MPDETSEQRELLPVAINAAVATLPDGWKSKFSKLALKIIGVKSIPQLTKQIADEIDTISGRSLVSEAMAKAVAHKLTSDPDQVERAIGRFYADVVENQKNLENITKFTAEELSSNYNESEPQDEISTDWRKKFSSYASEISDPEMQRVWAKILAGEFKMPGSFSFRTLRLVSEMDLEVAEIFSRLCIQRIADNAIVAVGSDWLSGIKFRESKILEDWSLIHETPNQTHRTVTKDRDKYFIWGLRFGAMIHAPEGPPSLDFGIMQLTSSGRDLLKLIGDNDERPVIRDVVDYFKKNLPNSPVSIIGKREDKGDISHIVSADFIWGDADLLAIANRD